MDVISSLDQTRYMINEIHFRKFFQNLKAVVKLSNNTWSLHYWLGWGIKGNREIYSYNYSKKLSGMIKINRIDSKTSLETKSITERPMKDIECAIMKTYKSVILDGLYTIGMLVFLLLFLPLMNGFRSTGVPAANRRLYGKRNERSRNKKQRIVSIGRKNLLTSIKRCMIWQPRVCHYFN